MKLQKFALTGRLKDFGRYSTEVEAPDITTALAQERAALEARGWIIESLGPATNRPELTDEEKAAQEAGS